MLYLQNKLNCNKQNLSLISKHFYTTRNCLKKWFLATLFISFSALANDDATTWLSKMKTALSEQQFEMSFVVVHGNKADPWRWYHGQISGQEIEVLTSLNGPGQQIVRRGDNVTYLQPEQLAYTIQGNVPAGPIPEIIRSDISKISQWYDFHLVGKSRVAGLPARLIRVIAKDNNRFNYWLWLHEESGLLLKSALINQQGEVLEQLQVSNLQIQSEPNELIAEVAKAELPEPYNLVPSQSHLVLDWSIGWMPEGFAKVKSDQHYLLGQKEIVDYMMLTDGVVWFSVYVRRLNTGDKITIGEFSSGANHYASHQIGEYEVTLIGKIPPKTANQLLKSIYWN